jgi:hypothetical protein
MYAIIYICNVNNVKKLLTEVNQTLNEVALSFVVWNALKFLKVFLQKNLQLRYLALAKNSVSYVVKQKNLYIFQNLKLATLVTIHTATTVKEKLIENKIKKGLKAERYILRLPILKELITCLTKSTRSCLKNITNSVQYAAAKVNWLLTIATKQAKSGACYVITATEGLVCLQMTKVECKTLLNTYQLNNRWW